MPTLVIDAWQEREAAGADLLADRGPTVPRHDRVLLRTDLGVGWPGPLIAGALVEGSESVPNRRRNGSSRARPGSRRDRMSPRVKPVETCRARRSV